jgi:papain like protease
MPNGRSRSRGLRSTAILILTGFLAAFSACKGTPPGSGGGGGGMRSGKVAGCILGEADELAAIPMIEAPVGDPLPSFVDLSPELPPPGNQGRQGSCVGFATAYALRSYLRKLEDGKPLTRANGHPDPERVMSPAYVYNQLDDGTDRGIKIMAGLHLIYDQGVASLRDFPYDDQDTRRQPSSEVKKAALANRITFWGQVGRDLAQVKRFLAGGSAIVIGALVDEGFVAGESGFGGAEFLWKSVRGPLDPHAMVVVGYDDRKRAIKLLNSWGTAWGNRGYAWMDYDLFPDVVRELYVAGVYAAGARNPQEKVQVQGEIPAIVEVSEGGRGLEVRGVLPDSESYPLGMAWVQIRLFRAGPGAGPGAPIRTKDATIARGGVVAIEIQVSVRRKDQDWCVWIPTSGLELDRRVEIPLIVELWVGANRTRPAPPYHLRISLRIE